MIPLAQWDEVEPESGEVGHLAGTWTDLGEAAGSVTVGVNRIQVPEGRWSTPAHVELGEEEIFYVLGGSGISLQGDEAYEVGAGDCLAHLIGARTHTLRAGPGGIDVLAWEAFGREWVVDIVEQLKLPDTRALLAPYGDLPDLGQVDFDRDVVFAWNGTTSGVRVPNADWIPADRKGLTICDATSAVFAQAIDWSKLDVTTFSWQKVLGGEAQHGILILSPRAVERLESYTPPWPLPKLFRMTRDGKLMEDLFAGSTINTPSMLCLEDYLDALDWVDSVGGLEGTIARSDANAAVLSSWVERTAWVDFLAHAPETRSNTSVCLKIVDPDVAALPPEERDAVPAAVAALLDAEDAAKDVASHRAAKLAADHGRTATLEATLRASLGVARRRPGMNNDLNPFTPAPLEGITCPTLIVHARSDKAVPPASAEYAHAHITGSELYWMDGSHVAFALEAADTAPAYVLDWLRHKS